MKYRNALSFIEPIPVWGVDQPGAHFARMATLMTFILIVAKYRRL
jgi:hypothetical protein